MKELAKKYYEAVNDYDPKMVGAMITENYIQHNPFVPTGKQAFLNLLPALEVHKTKILNQRLFQDQNYVIMHHHWTNAQPLGASELSAIHVIRFNSDKLIAEHWNVTSTELDFEGPKEITNKGQTFENKKKIQNLYQGKKLHRIFGEENFVLAIYEEDSSAKYDLFFMENKTIKNQWKIYQYIPTENFKNQNTMFNFNSSF
ncbi:MAG: hypothetical protein CME65_15945 [Halobacteriovoraceae bacterium]|nr:hypothetical protein [Halobacteriovoraceae bacterium]|tara:strand:- start:16998 stop:17600 length:603 start_codon:yes stop_codon:yes gene_type:complete